MATIKLTLDQIADIFKRIVGRDPTHNDYPAIVGLSNMDGMTVQKIEEFFAPLKTFVIPAPAPVKVVPAPVPPAPIKVAVPVAPPVPAPVKVTPAPAHVNLAPSVEPKPVVKAVPPVSVPVKQVKQEPVLPKAEPIPHPKPTAWDNDDKTPVDMPKAEKHVDKHDQTATIHGKKKGKNK